jgi:hypothetical protein
VLLDPVDDDRASYPAKRLHVVELLNARMHPSAFAFERIIVSMLRDVGNAGIEELSPFVSKQLFVDQRTLPHEL